MKKLIFIIAIIFNVVLIQAQNSISFVTYKSINKSYTKEHSDFNNEYDSEYKFIFYPDKIVNIDLRLKKLAKGLEDLVNPESYTHTIYIDELYFSKSGSLVIKMQGDFSDSRIDYYEIISNKLDHLVSKSGKVIFRNTSLFKDDIQKSVINYYRKKKLLK